ncbi:MAG: orotate phosphoribosyltransferase [Alphaproteobacteria bacterium]|nr:orotate phosphoribosyltransferase [Alphaproteobacteria bacterium]
MSTSEVIKGLAEVNAVKFGEFTYVSGKKGPVYIDLRLLAAKPSLLKKAAAEYAKIINNLTCDRIAAIPLSGLPIGAAVSLETDIPLIYPRDKAKAHGRSMAIEGTFKAGEKVVVVEDLATTGSSVIKGVEKLREAGLIVEDAIVLLDRESGADKNLEAHGLKLHSAFTMTEMLNDLYAQDAISEEQKNEVLDFVKSS